MSESFREEIEKLQEELADLKAERQYTLGQSGVHISAKKVMALMENYDREIEDLQIRIRDLGGIV